MTITCPSCKTKMIIPDGHIERQAELGKLVYCPVCHWTLIKNDGKLTVHVTVKEERG